MSLILDALRRADSARARDVATRVAQTLPPRARRAPLWPWFAAAAIGAAVAAFVATRSAVVPATTATTATTAPTVAAAAPAPSSSLAEIPVPVRDATDAAMPAAPMRGALPAAVRASLPAVVLDAHVWSDDPEKRFVMVGGRVLRVGDPAGDGLVVTAIAQDGVEFSWRGTRFRVPAR